MEHLDDSEGAAIAPELVVASRSVRVVEAEQFVAYHSKQIIINKLFTI